MTESVTSPRRALDQIAPQTARPRRRRNLRLARLDHRVRDARTRRPDQEHLLLIGPSGGPVWTNLSRP